MYNKMSLYRVILTFPVIVTICLQMKILFSLQNPAAAIKFIVYLFESTWFQQHF